MSEKKVFQCPECGLHYRGQQIVKQCEAFCKKHKACSMEIATQAVENEKKQFV